MCKNLARAVGLYFLPPPPPENCEDPGQPVRCYWCRPSHVAWQEWTDVTLLLHGKHFLFDNSFCFRMPIASTGLCALLWGTAEQCGEEQRWAFTQQSWAAFHDHAAEACSGWGGLPQIASTQRQERMTLTWTNFGFFSFSSCHHLPTSCSCHLPLAVRLDSPQSDFWFSPFKLYFDKYIKYSQGPSLLMCHYFEGQQIHQDGLAGLSTWEHAMPCLLFHTDVTMGTRKYHAELNKYIKENIFQYLQGNFGGDDWCQIFFYTWCVSRVLAGAPSQKQEHICAHSTPSLGDSVSLNCHMGCIPYPRCFKGK